MVFATDPRVHDSSIPAEVTLQTSETASPSVAAEQTAVDDDVVSPELALVDPRLRERLAFTAPTRATNHRGPGTGRRASGRGRDRAVTGDRSCRVAAPRRRARGRSPCAAASRSGPDRAVTRTPVAGLRRGARRRRARTRGDGCVSPSPQVDPRDGARGRPVDHGPHRTARIVDAPGPCHNRRRHRRSRRRRGPRQAMLRRARRTRPRPPERRRPRPKTSAKPKTKAKPPPKAALVSRGDDARQARLGAGCRRDRVRHRPAQRIQARVPCAHAPDEHRHRRAKGSAGPGWIAPSRRIRVDRLAGRRRAEIGPGDRALAAEAAELSRDTSPNPWNRGYRPRAGIAYLGDTRGSGACGSIAPDD